ncbi:aminotransferase [Oceanicola sp. 22II-s10i]|uniref:DegT/DnrJ/EryC1/StrS family aminotransferase n=1 Tax=Oceanicola sp. 22II-s10i TaxID=1317116 RepID=UPI000B52142D|nr:DegT/DnrJ/EryC1/StrS family aminotransferase [Oceanicola sp. 22II-s10i]OWU84767.1 aminotransferase [Oceanicola sp. 22II-s10i]
MQRLGFKEWLAAGRAIARGDLLRDSSPGQACAKFEERLCAMLGARHALTVNSGTTALVTALAALEVGPGDEVLVPAYTWMSSAAAPVHVGAVPVLVDIDETLTIDPEDIERKITPHTRAIIPVHMNNRPCNMDAIMAIARKHNLLVIEDACQAIGVKYGDRYCGTIGDAGTLSFNQHKNMTAGEGGAVLFNSDRAYARAFNFHDIGMSFRNRKFADAEPEFLGFNYRASEITGAMLNVQLSRLPRRLAGMRRRRDILRAALRDGGHPVAPSHDDDAALGLVVTFDTEDEATAFATRRGVARIHDNTKHVYTNWAPIMNKRTFHPRMNPWEWAQSRIEYTPDMCRRTLDLMRRSCRIGLGESYPVPLVRASARQFRQG